MNLTKIMQNRYSTKAFDPAKTISQEDFAQLKTVLRLSPSSINLQPWHFIIADDQTGRERIAKACVNSYASNKNKILNASHVIVFCALAHADKQYLQQIADKEEKDGRYKDASVKEHMAAARSNFLRIHRFEHKDEAHWYAKQVYLSMGTLLIGAAALGIDATPLEGIESTILDEEFNLQEQGYTALTAVALGYHREDDFNAKLPKSRLDETMVFSKA